MKGLRQLFVWLLQKIYLIEENAAFKTSHIFIFDQFNFR